MTTLDDPPDDDDGCVEAPSRHHAWRWVDSKGYFVCLHCRAIDDATD